MSNFLDLYLQVREKEGRLYPDDIVRQLPAVPANHPLFSEWQARSAACDRLTTYLTRLRDRATLLELGCGNGWLANRIAETTNASVIGLDLNGRELHQARRVFAQRPNLSWILTDFTQPPFAGRVVDIVVIASAIQYFANLTELFETLVPWLRKEGEIHILDSPIYSPGELPAARERSRQYYAGLGFPEMTAHYHHHSADALTAHNARWLYVPQRPRSRPRSPERSPARSPERSPAAWDSPFPWVRLRPNL
jgi:SAM-dependent methyltransferase